MRKRFGKLILVNYDMYIIYITHQFKSALHYIKYVHNALFTLTDMPEFCQQTMCKRSNMAIYVVQMIHVSVTKSS